MKKTYIFLGSFIQIKFLICSTFYFKENKECLLTVTKCDGSKENPFSDIIMALQKVSDFKSKNQADLENFIIILDEISQIQQNYDKKFSFFGKNIQIFIKYCFSDEFS